MIESPAPAITLVGTAHISPTSVLEVEQSIRNQRPARVLVELDARRLEALRDPAAWQRTDIVQVIKQKKQHLFLLQLYLASVQARMGRQTGVSPGAELLKAVTVAHEVGAQVVLIDRDIAITLKRGFGALGFWARMRLLWNVWMELLTPAAGEEKLDVDAMLKTDAITKMTEEFARFAPQVKVALIDERDAYMASHIQEAATTLGLPTHGHPAEQQVRGAPTPGASPAASGAGMGSNEPAGGPTGPAPSAVTGGLVAVVGAGHLPGIRARLAAGLQQDRVLLDQPPAPRFSIGKAIGWAFPIAVLAIFGWLGYQGYQQGDYKDLGLALGEFALITGTGAAVGAALAFGHPWSILTAFLAAPIATLHPLIASGWFAGLVEAKVRTPTVADFEAVKRIETFKQFWRNGVARILLVTALTNLGAMVALMIATGRLFRIFGVGT